MNVASVKNNVVVQGNLKAEQTLVLGHGFGSDQSAWRYILPDLINEYKIITYDNIGAGLSDPEAYNADKYSRLSSYADDLIDLCDEFDIRDAIYVGHSVSGMIGVLASIKAPEFFSKLVLINASPHYLNEGEYVGGFSQSDLKSLFDSMNNNYQAWVSGFSMNVMGNSLYPRFAQEFARTLRALRPDIALAVARVIFQSDLRNEIENFSKESLIIQSNRDIAVPIFVGEYLHDKLPNSRLHVIDADGHFPHISTPHQIVEALRSFI
jgi:sigma-B regulation protein RsbQ